MGVHCKLLYHRSVRTRAYQNGSGGIETAAPVLTERMTRGREAGLGPWAVFALLLISSAVVLCIEWRKVRTRTAVLLIATEYCPVLLYVYLQTSKGRASVPVAIEEITGLQKTKKPK